jgi:hydroxyacylglutathione hydrolase
MIVLTYYKYLFYIVLSGQFFMGIDCLPREKHHIIKGFNMLNVEQFPYGSDNFAYLIFGQENALAIDGGAWKEILSFLEHHHLTLRIVTNTHSHYDHTSGNDPLIKETGADFLKCSTLPDNHQILMEENPVVLYRTPGHTDDSVCFHVNNYLITGDTLFNGTIGNCFSGNQKNFFASIKKIMAFPDNTVIFSGHDYVLDSLTFASHLEPDNKKIELFRNFYHSSSRVYSTLADERSINPYLRFNEAPIIDLLRKKGLPGATEWERWNSLMSFD